MKLFTVTHEADTVDTDWLDSAGFNPDDICYARWLDAAFLGRYGRARKPIRDAKFLRIFNDDRELHWRIMDEGVRLVLLSESEVDVPFGNHHELEVMEPVRGNIFETRAGEFLDFESFPSLSSSRIGIGFREYSLQQDDRPLRRMFTVTAID